MATTVPERSAAADVPLPALAPADPQRSDLARRLLLTVLLLVVARALHAIPLPGFDPVIVTPTYLDLWEPGLGGFGMLRSSPWSLFSIGALGVTPYISAWIIVHLVVACVPSVQAPSKPGRMRLNDHVRCTALAIALLQGYAVATEIDHLQTLRGISATADTGLLFRLPAALSLAAGSLFLVWLGEQITEFGIGFGVPLIIASGFVTKVPEGLASVFDLWSHAAIPGAAIVVLLAAVSAVILATIVIQRVRYIVPVRSPSGREGCDIVGGEARRWELGFNPAGIIPLLCTSAFVSGIGLHASPPARNWTLWLDDWAAHGGPTYLALHFLFIIFAAVVFALLLGDSTATADELKRSCVFIPGIPPGEATADHLRRVSTRLAALGGTALAAMALGPEIVSSAIRLPGFLDGTGLMTVAMVTLAAVPAIRESWRRWNRSAGSTI
jgi:preprotein translocase subunit SecY